jgi:hypothetical protein
MLTSFRRFATALLAALGVSLSASAATSSTDFTDLWLTSGENGWGLNIIQQESLIFATLYVYDAAGNAHFFSASSTVQTGTNSFSGPLYETRGTYYATVPYVSGPPPTQVGTFTLNFSNANAGTLTYTVNGQTITKQIQRFAFRGENLTGNYLGGLTATSTCGGASQLTLVFDTLRVTHSGTSISMTVTFFNAAGVSSSCTYSGTYSQNGRLGAITGSYTCAGGAAPIAGSFTISNIDAQQTGFSGRFTGSDQFCSSHSGYFGGVRDVI